MLKTSLNVIYLLVILLQAGKIYTQDITTDQDDENNDDDVGLKENPEETGNYFEGDIDGIPENLELLQRNGVASSKYRWRYGLVPYTIEGNFSTNELAIISHAINEYHKKTCIRFQKRTTERDYVAIVNNRQGCSSSMGRQGGRQEVNLESRACFTNYGTTIHELMHALGFFHEQNRYERDSYIRVLTENIKPGMMVNFEKLSRYTGLSYGVPYDYASVMHYKPTSFSKNGKPTIEALKATPEAALMGQRQGFSNGDLFKIKAMYKC